MLQRNLGGERKAKVQAGLAVARLAGAAGLHTVTLGVAEAFAF